MPAKSRFAIIDENVTARVNASTCKTCDFLANPTAYQAGKADAEFIGSLLRTRSAQHVARVLDEGGVKIGETSIKRHIKNHSGS
jgi:hypothetical protein